MDFKFRKFQDGGAMTPQDGTTQPAEGTVPDQGSQDPMAQIINAAALAVLSQDCQTAMQVCQVLVQMAQQGAGGLAPTESPAEEGEPVYRAGGKLVRRIK